MDIFGTQYMLYKIQWKNEIIGFILVGDIMRDAQMRPNPGDKEKSRSSDEPCDTFMPLMSAKEQ